ncbi:hypothetical protein GCM10028809_42700 [Spirosoma gilvum]
MAEEPIYLYEFPSFSGDPVLTASVGDTVSATGTKVIQLGGQVPVEYAGYRFYSPTAKARFLYIRKVHSKRDAMAPGVTYAARLRYNARPATVSYITEEDTGEWYGQVTTTASVLKEPNALARTILTLPKDAVVKIKRHNYNYWEVSINGTTGYVGAFYILDYSRSASPFIKTAYTGPTYDPNGPAYYKGQAYSSGNRTYGYTPSTGATIHIGPRGGQYYYNSRGNKTYLSKSNPYRIGGSSSGSSYKYKSSGSTYRYRSSGSRSSYRSSGGRRK